ncbi:T9SS C-terminal target domain-containing protein [Aquimarina sp. AD10]|uniref:PA domain-containing protein n=1 Tax=Aquimarina sp. AD10 TaxID=1714849 RepID=UPI000E4BA2CB|nr:PA domain-containing protein [Aquimarina sp. AD10]AXT61863.1 T9SS C-terminal target domain-containing protein [Aquimarina sp. AD10]RKN02659.1 T9SS C-terminal target domain-containing protein [Aquimarina sp. AD10]
MKTTLLKKLLVLGLLFGAVSNILAQQDFRPRQNISTRGDILLIGNAIHGIQSNPNENYDTLGTNNGSSFDTAYIDIDGDNSTFSSSSADLENPSTENCSTIVYAGLYWTANYYLARGGIPTLYIEDEIPTTDFDGTGRVNASTSNTVLTLNNSQWADTYFLRVTEFSNDNSDIRLSPASSNLVVAAPRNGCGITNAGALAGNIAVIDTGGSCTDREKVINAQNAGAIGVIIVNDNGNLQRATGDGATITIPSVTIGNNDIFGNNLIDVINFEANVMNATISTTGDEITTGLPLNDVRARGTADYKAIQLGFGAPGAVTYTLVQPQTGSQVIDVNGTRTTTHGGIIYDGYAGTASNPGMAASDNVPYTCYADVTAIVQANGYGTYTVANMKATVGDTSGVSGATGGWSLVVIYNDPSFEGVNKFMSVFDGFREIQPGTTSSTVDLPIEGFRTLAAPSPVNVKFGIGALEGDSGIVNDNLQIENTSGIYVDIFNAANPQDNFFNSSISVDGVISTNRNPASANTLGFDTDIFELPNNANDLIPNDATSANFRLSSNGDGYQAFMSVIAVEDILPELLLINEVYDPTDLNMSISGTAVEPGDALVYRLRVKNVGNENYAENVTIDDVLPANVDLESIDGIDVTANPIGNLATIPTIGYAVNIDSQGTQTLKLSIPADLLEYTSPSGPGDGELTVDFTVRVVSDCESLRDTCSNEITNLAVATYTGIVSGIQQTQQSANEVFECGNTDGLATNFLVNIPACTQSVSTCGGELILTAGTGYDRYTWSGPNGFSTVTTIPSVVVPPGNESGLYIVIKEDTNPADGICMTLTEEFDVINFASAPHPLQDDATVENFIDYFDNTNGGCSQPLAKINLCGDETYTVDSQANPDNLVAITWQQLTNDTCKDRTDSCPAVTGGCDAFGNWTTLPSGSGTPTTYEFTDAGEYRMVLEVVGGCTQIFYFDINKNDYQPEVDISDMECGNDGLVQVNNIPPGDTYRFVIRLASDPPPTTAQVIASTNIDGRFVIPFQTNPFLFTVYAVDTALPNCMYEIDGTIRSFDPVFDIFVTAPECTTIDNPSGLGSIRAEVIGGLPLYEYRIQGGPNAIDIVTGDEASNQGDYTFNDLLPGIYTVQIVSNRNPDPECIQEFANVVVPAAPAFTTRVDFIAPASCDTGAVVEVIVLEGSGGPYQFGFASGVFVSPDAGEPQDRFRFTLPTTAVPSDVFNFQIFDTSLPLSCIKEASISGIETYVPIEIASVVPSNPVCPTDLGTIEVSLTPSSAVAGRTFVYEVLTSEDEVVQSISTSNVTTTFTNIPSGTGYKIRASHNDTTDPTADSICPVVKEGYDIIVPSPITFDINLTRELSCISGNEDAQVTLSNFTGGTGDYEWSLNASGPFVAIVSDITSFPISVAGVYTIFVRNPNAPACPTSAPISINQLEEIDDIILTEGASSCENQTVLTDVTAFPALSSTDIANGVQYDFTIQPAPFSGPATFSITATTGMQPITFSRGIIYTIEAKRSDNECGIAKNYSADLINQIEITSLNPKDITCNGSLDGSVAFTVNSSNFGYEIFDSVTGFMVSNPLSTVDTIVVSDLGTGTYTIRVFDITTNCEDISIFEITEPSALNASTEIVPLTTINDGKIIVNTDGGTPPYQYSLDGGNIFETSNTFENLPSGTFTIFIRDSNGCIKTVSATIDPLILPISVVLNLDSAFISCFGESNASIKSNVTGGTGIYEYVLTGTSILGETINSGPQTSNTFSGLFAGTYLYTVNGEGAEHVSVPFTITNPPEFLSEVTLSSVSCNGENNGTVTILATGGTPPYSFAISSIPNTFFSDDSDGIFNQHVFKDLGPGTYDVLAQDTNGCEQLSTIEILENTPIHASVVNSTPEICFGDSNGSVVFEISGGTPPYQTNITNNDVDFVEGQLNYDNLPSGITTIYIRDANSCITTLSVDILEASAIFLNVTVTPITNDADGVIEVIAKGGNPPYIYQLKDIQTGTVVSEQLSNTFTVGSSGEYLVEVLDSNGCIVGQTVTMESTAQNPIIEYADEIFFCTITGQIYPTIAIENANGETLDIPFLDVVSVVWQKFNDINCDIELQDNCPTTDSSCTSGWFNLCTTNDCDIADAGEYRVVIEFANKSTDRIQTYYFKAERLVPDTQPDFVMYPNPATSLVQINKQVKSIEVFDVMGKLVLQTSESTYDVASLTNGIYFVKVVTNTNDEVFTRLVKK